MSGKKSIEEIEDLHLHFIVLLTMIVNKIGELEEEGQIFGRVKFFLKNSLKHFLEFVETIYDKVDKKNQIQSTEGVVILIDRVEKALQNQYVLTKEEREARLTDVLYDSSLSEDEIHKIIQLVEDKNILKY